MYNYIKAEGAAALAPALQALTGLTKLELWGNHISWARLQQMATEGEELPGIDMAHARLLHPLLKSMVARGGCVDLEEEQVRSPL